MTDTPSPLKPARPVRKTAARAAQAGVNIVWLVPILALVVTLAIAWTSFRDRGSLIDIEFADATGVTPGETTLRFREIVVGRVEAVRFTHDLARVVVSVRVNKDIAPFIDDQASFWIVRPQVSAQGVSRLDTVLTGAFIEGYWDADPTAPETRFVGLDRPPLTRNDTPGTWVALSMQSAESLSEGAPVLFRGLQVGRIENLRLDDGADRVIADAFIEAPHDQRLTSASMFWDISGFSVSLGAAGLSLNVSSLSSLLQGGVAFDTMISGGQPVERGHIFAVQPDEDTARNNLFADQEGAQLRLSMLVDDSLRGLTRGADVQFQGLRVGQVTDLAVAVTDAPIGSDLPRVQQRVTLSVSPSLMGLGADATADDALEFLDVAVQDGLRARVASTGFLGTSLMVELVHLDDPGSGRLDRSAEPNPMIPTAPGSLDDFSGSAQGLMDRVSRLPIEDLMASATQMMNSITAIASSNETRALPGALRDTLNEGRDALANIGEFGRDLNDAGTAQSIARMVDEAAVAMESVRVATENAPQMVATISETAEKVRDIDFAAIGAQAEGILADLRAMLGSEDAEQLPRNLSDTLQAMTGLLNDLRDGGAVGNLNAALASASAAADQVAASVRELPALVTRLQSTAARTEQVIAGYGPRSPFNNEAIAAMREMRRATEAFGSLARMIERNPRAFILGR
ncbi:intermembrane transport protein PqiB [Paracoccus sp. (in: a-proteobacteria)]|uniref:PqiB family protein n=1 Tax=Paracoccus sp. TaxID=267 RepID=UPI0026DF37A5|nr:MlaD family protein [Paracoccus sp. (in: a-proteobacteria)]MDO5647486.1 MlaD family protein [Paracoccus sp. (in: a-proteobacteria)]